MGVLISKIMGMWGHEGAFRKVACGIALAYRAAGVSVALFLEHKVIIVGLDNAGKTTILYQLCVAWRACFAATFWGAPTHCRCPSSRAAAAACVQIAQ
jgi:hypothetical protein